MKEEAESQPRRDTELRETVGLSGRFV
jgi:hypothetical protein